MVGLERGGPRTGKKGQGVPKRHSQGRGARWRPPGTRNKSSRGTHSGKSNGRGLPTPEVALENRGVGLSDLRSTGDVKTEGVSPYPWGFSLPRLGSDAAARSPSPLRAFSPSH